MNPKRLACRFCMTRRRAPEDLRVPKPPEPAGAPPGILRDTLLAAHRMLAAKGTASPDEEAVLAAMQRLSTWAKPHGHTSASLPKFTPGIASSKPRQTLAISYCFCVGQRDNIGGRGAASGQVNSAEVM